MLCSETDTTSFFPSVIALSNDESHPFIALEFLHGLQLTEILLDVTKHLSKDAIEKAIKDMIQICDLLYTKGIVHRDIRPANIIINVSSNGMPSTSLIDFAYATLPSKVENSAQVSLDSQQLMALGEDYKPEPYLWDDAYSFLKIGHMLLSVERTPYAEELINELSQRVGRFAFKAELSGGLVN